jgi:hypothetical protein
VEFTIEALLFAIIVAISAWPIMAVASALSEFVSARRPESWGGRCASREAIGARSNPWEGHRTIGSHQQRDSPFGGGAQIDTRGRVLPEFDQRESLDTERIAFRMCSLWEVAIERDTIAKLKENSWSNGCRTI